MDVRKLLSLGMDDLSCVQCCSVLADDTNHSPKAAGILVSSFSPFSVLQPQYIACFTPAPSPGCQQLSVAPGRDLSHIRSMTEGVFLCFTPDPGAGCRHRSKQTCMHLLPTARPATGDGAEANQAR